MRAVLASLIVLSSPVAAQTPDCSDLTTLPQQSINLCLAQAYQRADAELNVVYQAARARSSAPVPDLLRDTQRAWIPFRDAACEAEAELMRGGSGEPMMRLSCLIRLTETRTDELRMFAEMN